MSVVRFVPIIVWVWALLSCASEATWALEALPYSTRTQPFTGWSGTVRGDIRTVGMAGATVGLADTFLATGSNPAGLAMTLGGADLNFANNSVHDSHVQAYEDPVSSNSYGTALSGYPWGVGFGYKSPYGEGAPYIVGGATVFPKVSTRMFELSLARVFENTVSLGMGISFGQAEIQIDDLRGTSSAYHSYAVGGNFGIMFQLPGRFLLAGSHSTPMHFSAATEDNPSPIISGFYQPVEVPSRSTLGLGWIPNRFFRADFDLSYIGSTPTAALIRDQNLRVGSAGVYEPRFGMAYTFLDYKELQGTVFAGTYFEIAREQGTSNRLHGTSGIEIKPWVLTIGWGFDRSTEYWNYLFSFGIDVFKLMEKGDLIPTPWQPPRQGLMPNPFHSSDLGLPRPLVKNWKARGPDMNPLAIAKDIPKRLGEKVEDFADTVTGTAEPDPIPEFGEAPKKKPASKKAKKKPTKSKTKRVKTVPKRDAPRDLDDFEKE